MIRRVAISLVLAMTITALAACNSNSQGRTTIKDGDKTITILEPKSTLGNEELKVEKIEEYKDIRALDWQDEDKLLISKKNTNVDKISSEGEEFYPNNLFIFDTNSKESKILRSESANQLFAEFSPDKKHIFYKKNQEETAGGYVMDSQGQNEVSITGGNTIHVMAGRWIDNERVIYPDFGGVIYEGDISGKIVELVNLNSGYISDVFKIEDQIYYCNLDMEVKKYNLTTKESIVVEKDVVTIIPSWDTNRIAYIKRTTEDNMELIVADMNFSNKKTLALGTSIIGTTWSMDNSRLVFSVTKEEVGEMGTYVSDLKEDTITRIASFVDVIGMSWSPSGKKIAVYRIDLENEKNDIWTSVITLSK